MDDGSKRNQRAEEEQGNYLLDMWEVVPDDLGEHVIGIAVLHGQECIGGWREWGGDIIGSIWAERPRVETRATWSDEKREWEERAWQRLCQPVHERWLGKRKSPLQALRDRYRHDCNPEEHREAQRRRYIAESLRRTLMAEWEAAGRMCGICGQTVDPEELPVIDHITAISKGGTSERPNLRLTHRYCNGRKGSLDDEDPYIRQRHPACVKKP